MMDVEREQQRLEAMSTDQLRERYAELWDHEPRSRHRVYLIRKILWRIQADAEGGVAERVRRLRARAAELADLAHVRTTPPRSEAEPTGRAGAARRQRVATVAVSSDPRLPGIGTTLTRRYKGKLLQVTVLADGFEFEGEHYRSLTAVARAATGAHRNGYRFFKLRSHE